MPGTHNSVKANGVTSDLFVPSGIQSVIKLNVDNTIRANQRYEILLDFNAEKSIIATGNDSFQMKPVIEIVK